MQPPLLLTSSTRLAPTPPTPSRRDSLDSPSLPRRALLAWLAAPGACGATAAHATASARSPSQHSLPAPETAAARNGLTQSAPVQQLLHWAVARGDAADKPFAIVDKPNACMHVFAPAGPWLGSAPVLLGSARGDRSAPGIGTKPLAQIRPEERTTPAGRFVTEPGVNLQGDDLVWLDYDSAVSLHRVRNTLPAERRLERLASPRVADRRISHGCINVPQAFYDAHIAPWFGVGPGIVYVVPDTESFATFFAAARAYR